MQEVLTGFNAGFEEGAGKSKETQVDEETGNLSSYVALEWT